MINLFLNFYINIQVAGQIVMVNITNLITHCECCTDRGEHWLNTHLRQFDDRCCILCVFCRITAYYAKVQISASFLSFPFPPFYSVCFHVIWCWNSEHRLAVPTALCLFAGQGIIIYWYAYTVTLRMTAVVLLCCVARHIVRCVSCQLLSLAAFFFFFSHFHSSS